MPTQPSLDGLTATSRRLRTPGPRGPCRTSGRRHIRAGSVRVSELLDKQTPDFDIEFPVELTEVWLDDPYDRRVLDQPPNSHRLPASRTTQIAKIVGLGVASFVLCASIVYGSVITRQRQEQGTPDQAPVPAAAVELSGEQALLPDQLNRAMPHGGIPAMPRLPGPPTRATDTIENPGVQRRAAPPGRPYGAGEAAKPAGPSRTELVEQFYRLAATWPARAFALLDPDLLDADVATFVRSWSTVSGLEIIDVRDRGGDVLAVIRLRLADGTHLRVQQLLDVSGTPPRIVGAEILSAQRN